MERIVFPVTLSDGNTYSLVGYLYSQGSARNRRLQVTLHGGNYTHTYWDIPTLNGHPYSYARYMAEQHYAVLALDLLGTGESSKPDADFISFQEMGSAVHQVLVRMRTGDNPAGHAFDSIALVGHSIGSALAAYVQGTYHDADALVSTGLVFIPYARPLDPALVQEIATRNPYFKLPPEVRRTLFYNGAETAPEVLAHDAQLDDVIPRGYVFTLFPFLDNPAVTRVDQVKSPVLVQLGERDVLAPGVLAPREAAVWTGASSRTVQVIPDSGHAFNAHANNRLGWGWIDTWLSQTLGKR
ncbi:alpha/beta hydrolase [Archangium sp.]|uniref:alpha/beta hydrolase n=1 Tax=Archangium sp. TaxID=1872627 RepID=UPI002ED79E0D